LIGGIFILQTILQLSQNLSLLSFLGLSCSGIEHGLIYTFFTYPLFQTDLMSGLFSCLILWYTGSDLESSWGTKNYLKFIFTMTLLSGLFFLLIVSLFFSHSFIAQLPLAGSSGLCFALLVAYAMIYPERYFSFFMLFPMKAMHFCLLLGAVQLYTALFSPVAKTTWGHLSSMGFAYLYLLWAQKGFSWSLPIFGRKKSSRASDLKKIRHPHLFLVKDDEDDSGPPKKGGGPNHRNWH
jgi:membrane associated rhomboid family serine protease